MVGLHRMPHATGALPVSASTGVVLAAARQAPPRKARTFKYVTQSASDEEHAPSRHE